MFSRRIDERIVLQLTIPHFAGELFKLTNANRPYLRQWLPWLDQVQDIDDTKSFIKKQLQLFADGKALHATIFLEGKIAGVVAYNTIDSSNASGQIGYWLAEKYCGSGIMTACVSNLVDLGQDFLRLHRVEIRCATENKKSRAIPERLGFEKEGVLRRVEKVNNQWFDHVLYAKLLG